MADYTSRMAEKTQRRIVLAGLVALAAGMFLAGIGWGLPSRAVDRFLFGERRPWSGKQIMELAGGAGGDGERGADVDRNPILRGDGPVLLNGDDGRRAEIVRRYRLFTYQPDEMITLMSLAGMGRRGDLDPRLYQYGGLWIYPAGGLIVAGRVLGLIDLRADEAYYLDHPEAFGRLYVAARLYAVLWGLVGVWAVFRLGELLAGRWAGVLAAGLYLLMPVVVNMTHEAKPHLPGAVLMLLAVVAAARYVRDGGRWWLTAGALCGAAQGMVLSSLAIFVILPVMVFLRPIDWRRRVAVVAGAVMVGVAVYSITNPYVIAHLFWKREILLSNLHNSQAMYVVSIAGTINGLQLMAEGAGWAVLVAGILGVIARFREGEAPAEPGPHSRDTSARQEPRPPKNAIAALLVIPAVLSAAQFMLLAAGKPGEFGRFFVFVDIVLAIFAAALAARLPRGRWPVAAVLLLVTGYGGVVYARGFVRDCRPMTSRLAAAERLAGGAGDLHVADEPAPYCLPPVDLFRRRLWLSDDANVRVHEDGYISWADRDFELRASR